MTDFETIFFYIFVIILCACVVVFAGCFYWIIDDMIKMFAEQDRKKKELDDYFRRLNAPKKESKSSLSDLIKDLKGK